MRILEIMTDFRGIQTQITRIRVSAPLAEASEWEEEGFAELRRCVAEARALLGVPFEGSSFSSVHGRGTGEDAERETVVMRRCVRSKRPLIG